VPPDAEQDVAAIVRRSWDIAPAELPAMAGKIWADDIVYREDPRWPGAGEFHGREAAIARFAGYMTSITGVASRVLEVEARGDLGFCKVEILGQGLASDAPIDHVWGYFVRLREGKITEIDAYLDPEQARRRFRDG
jgi:ketosteroid isomerase-like protein